MGCPSSPDAHTETWTKAFGFPGVSKITYRSQKGEYSELLPSRRPQRLAHRRGPRSTLDLPDASPSFPLHLQLCVILPSPHVASGAKTWRTQASSVQHPCWTILYSGQSLSPVVTLHPGSVSKTPQTSMVSQAEPCGVAVEFGRALNGAGKRQCAFVQGTSSLNEHALKVISLYF